MNKEWRKAIYERTRLKNIYYKKRSKENWNKYKKQRNLCVKLRKKSMKSHFEKVTVGKAVSSNKNFWRIIKPFLTNKGFITNSDIALKVGSEIITNDQKLSETFNDHYRKNYWF